MPKIIEHEVNGNKIRPKGKANNRTLVSRGEDLIFALPTGFVAGTVTFHADSPFGGNAIPYPASVQVPSNAPAGVYVYSCVAKDQAGHELSSDDGGEVEVGNAS